MNYILQRRVVLALLLCCATASAQTPPADTFTPPAPAAAPSSTPAAGAPDDTTKAEPAPAKLPPVIGDDNTLVGQLPPEQVLWLNLKPEQTAATAAATGAATPQNAADELDTAPAPQVAAGEESEQSTRFLARHIPDLSGEGRGAVIILHDSEQHPSWPFTVAALLDDLPLHGWNTLSIELPAPAQDATTLPPLPPPPKPKPVAPNQNGAEPAAAAASPREAAPGASTKSAEPPADNGEPAPAPKQSPSPEQLAQARIEAALDYLTETAPKTPVVLIGFGSGAYRAADFARRHAATSSAHATAPLAALALIAPRDRLPAAADNLPALLPQTGLPTLDMVLSSDAQARAEAEARRRAVLRQRERIYQRIEFPPINDVASPEHSAMVKRVRGFLQQQVRTEEKNRQERGAFAPRVPTARGAEQ